METPLFAPESKDSPPDETMQRISVSCPGAGPTFSVFESHGLPLDENTASIIRELNEPLCAMLLNASAGLNWLKRGEATPEMTEECLEDIVAQCKRVVGIIRELRVITRETPPA